MGEEQEGRERDATDRGHQRMNAEDWIGGEEPPASKLTCRSCGAEIKFLRTASGKSMPVDAETVEPGDTDYEHGRHLSHFSTCPDQNKWRKPR